MTYNQLQRPEGRLAYEVAGTSGPLVICVPGMGELRQSYRLLTPLLVAEGCRVVTLDIRGHGDSDATFSSYDDVALASDILALVDELGEPAFLVGNSMGAGASVIAAADAPEKVKGLALLGPFVRDPQGGAVIKLLFRVLLTKPWGPAAFMSYYPQWLPVMKIRLRLRSILITIIIIIITVTMPVANVSYIYHLVTKLYNTVPVYIISNYNTIIIPWSTFYMHRDTVSFVVQSCLCSAPYLKLGLGACREIKANRD